MVEDQYENRYSRASGPALERNDGDERTETERDRGRLGYSPFLRRLAGVTQVVSPDLTASQLHSRSSHTHKVALVAREIAEHIVRRAQTDHQVADVLVFAGGLDIAACEAAGLAHDLGHPPFGHAGERMLDQIMISHVKDGFEGNAQSFRIVTELDRDKLHRKDGLDLTNITLAAILKYPYLRKEGTSKFSAYVTEKEHFDRVRSATLNGRPDTGQQTLEASIMDLADDIAYAVHDLEDFFAAGLIDPRAAQQALLDSIGGVDDTSPDFSRSNERDAFTREANELRERYEPYFDDLAYLQALRDTLQLVTGISGPDEALGVIQLRTELSERVAHCFQQIRVHREPPYENGPLVTLDKPAWHELQSLKVITKQFLVFTAKMGTLQRAQTQVIRRLFSGMEEWLASKPAPKDHDLPVAFLRLLNAMPNGYEAGEALTFHHYRAIGDYICEMSDSEALLRSQWVSGSEVPGVSSSLGMSF